MRARLSRLLTLGLGVTALAIVLIVVTRVALGLLLALLFLLLLEAVALVLVRWAQREHVQALVLPALAVLISLVAGGVFAVATDQRVWQALARAPQDPIAALTTVVDSLVVTYKAWAEGSLGNPARIQRGLETWVLTGDTRPLLFALRPWSEGLVNTVPYLFTGLAVAVGFAAGLFNIGAEGQFILGGLAAAWVGFSIEGLPFPLHMVLALAGGALAGAVWGFIPGFLRAKTGAHEVITTIMMNHIAFKVVTWLVNGPLEGPPGTARTPDILPSARIPTFFPPPLRVHGGILIGVGMVVLLYYLLQKTTWGFELRTVGQNPFAAKYAGISIGRVTMLAMALSGLLAGMGGAAHAQGLIHNVSLGFSGGYGFDAIALALLGKNNPFGVLAASFLFGVMRAGETRLQSMAGVPREIISIVQVLVIIFIAAPDLVRSLVRTRGLTGRGFHLPGHAGAGE